MSDDTITEGQRFESQNPNAGKSTSWDMSQERAFLEKLLNQRFNFFLVMFSIVLAGATNSKDQLHFQLILTLGAIITTLFALVLERSQEKLDLILGMLFRDPAHPATIINEAARGVSRRRLIGITIPRFCCFILIQGAVLAWFNVLRVAPSSPTSIEKTVINYLL